MKISLYDTSVMNAARVKETLSRVVEYAVVNRNLLIPTETVIKLTEATRTILNTPMAEFFNRLVNSDGINNIAAIAVSPKAPSLPQSLVSPSITIDFKQVDSNMLKSIPELQDKILLNLTSSLKQDRSTGQYYISAVDILQDIYTRGQLVATYEDLGDNWMPAQALDFLVKSYSMILSSGVSRFFQCTVPEAFTVAAIFCLYISQRLTTSGDPFHPVYFNRANFCGTPRDLKELGDLAAETFDGKLDTGVMTKEQLCKLVSVALGGRFEDFNIDRLDGCCGHLGTDTIVSLTAMEYPPYWAYLLYKALSNTKTVVTYQLNNQKLVRECNTRFLEPILKYQPMFSYTRG